MNQIKPESLSKTDSVDRPRRCPLCNEPLIVGPGLDGYFVVQCRICDIWALSPYAEWQNSGDETEQ
jgi:hypothetical protein